MRLVDLEARAFGASVGRRVHDLIDAGAESVRADPSQYDLLGGNLSLIQRLDLPPQAGRRLDVAARQRLALAVIDGLPAAEGLTLLKSGELDEDLSPGARDRVLAETEARLEREQRELQIEEAVARSREVFRLLTEINRDEATHADIERLDAEVGLSAGERDRVGAAADLRVEAQRDELADIVLVDEALAGRGPLDPSNPFHRRAIDRHYLRAAQAWDDLSQDELSPRVAAYVAQVGAIPEPVADAIQSYAEDGAPQQQAAVVDLARRILTAAPSLLDDFDEEEIEALRRADRTVGQRSQQDPELILTAGPAALPLLLLPALPRLAPLLAPLAPLLLRGDTAQQAADDGAGEDEDIRSPRPDASGASRLPEEKPPRPPQPDFIGVPPDQRKDLRGQKPPQPPSTPEENILLGEEAISHVLATTESVPFAMYRQDVGWMTFDFGKPGNGPPKWRRGFGVSHILAKHGEEALRMLPQILARGDVVEFRGPPDARRVELKTGKFRAIVSLYRDHKRDAFVITAYDVPGEDEC